MTSLGEFRRFLLQHLESVRQQWRVEIVKDAADIHTRCSSLDEQARIDGWLEQRQLTHHPFDIHAMANLEEPVLDDIPIAHELVVLGNAEEKGQAERGAGTGLCRKGTSGEPGGLSSGDSEWFEASGRSGCDAPS